MDGTFEFSEVITIQAFRLQYPNGHHTNISPSLRKALYGTPSEEVTNFAILQDISNVRIRPAVLIWRVLRGLANAGLEPELHMNEVECYLMRCATQHDIDQCLHALKDARQGKVTLPPLQGTARRNAQDWLKFLALTPIFDTAATAIKLSSFALDHRVEIDALCLALERDESFWQPDTLDRADKLSWYRYFGGVDLSVPPQPLPETEIAQGQIRETEDPSSVDLLVVFRKTDFIIEVKTVTPENFVSRVRYAMGQVLHYDYLRSLQSPTPRRKVVALAAQLPQDSWAVPFLNTHLDTDLLTLQRGILRTDSLSVLSTELFA